jgi:hypothetical protein
MRTFLLLLEIGAEPPGLPELYRINAEAGQPRATLWRDLPGAPDKAFLLKNGTLFVSCDGGDVEVSPDGTLSIATETNTRVP